MQQTLRAGIVIGLFLTLAACGFHLRGLDQNGQIRPLAFSTLKIEATEAVDGRLLQQIKQQLVASEAQAQAVLKLSATQFQRITTAKDGDGDVTAELLKLQQPFALIAVASGKAVVQGAAVSYRDRSIDPDALLAAERELASQKTLMRQEVVQQILQRLSEITPQKWQKMSESPALPASQSTTTAQ